MWSLKKFFNKIKRSEHFYPRCYHCHSKRLIMSKSYNSTTSCFTVSKLALQTRSIEKKKKMGKGEKEKKYTSKKH